MQDTAQIYITIGVKLAVSFVLLLVYLNLSGRGHLAPNSAADQIGSYVLGGIVGGMLYNTAVSVTELVVVIALWSALMLLTRYAKGRSSMVRDFIDGNSIQLFAGGQLQTGGLRSANMSAKEFIAAMHLHGVHRVEELQSVWLETNGQFTILRRGEAPFAVAVVEDGELARHELHRFGFSEAWAREELEKAGAPPLKAIAYAEWYPATEGPAGAGMLAVYPYQ